MIVFSILVFIVYAVLILSFVIGFDRIKLESTNFEKPVNTFSIVIPFRNETSNLKELLASLLQLNYPLHLFEILLVNDASEDASCAIVEAFQTQYPELNIQLIQNNRKTNSPKKDAIITAVHIAAFDWIITTDADCEFPKNWLQSFNSCIEKNQPVFISAPVKFKEEKSFLFQFQNLNFLSLMGSTIGAFGITKPILCNGANLCYNKAVFQKLNGFEGNSLIASGDDIFLLEKMEKHYPTKTMFLKSNEVIVATKPENTWKSFFNQQIRWASKTGSYNNWFSKFVGLTVFITNLTLLVVGFSIFLDIGNWKFFIAVVIQKMFIDILLIEKSATFLNTKKSLQLYPVISLLYPFWTVFIAVSSLFKNYEWKGRKFNK